MTTQKQKAVQAWEQIRTFLGDEMAAQVAALDAHFAPKQKKESPSKQDYMQKDPEVDAFLKMGERLFRGGRSR